MSALNSVLTPGMTVNGVPRNALTRAGISRGLPIHEIGEASIIKGNEAVHLQRKHMIKRQRGDEYFAVGPDHRRDPRMNLAQIGDHVAMESAIAPFGTPVVPPVYCK